jgi:hypothetical protein
VERRVQGFTKRGVPQIARKRILIADRTRPIRVHPLGGETALDRREGPHLRGYGHDGKFVEQSPGDCSPGLVPVINPGSFLSEFPQLIVHFWSNKQK